jgi:two-component system cell cycle sensor histidine kinase PleC
MSKIESGTFELDFDLLSIEEALGAAVEIARPRIEDKRQQLGIQIERDVPNFAFDRRRVIQIVLNLLTNANKFTPEGGTVSLAAAQEPGWLLVSIADTGIGMTPDQVKHAQKPFAQVKSALTRDHEGTGLGLPLAKALVEQHGGTFRIVSEPLVGTRVEFRLPTTPCAALAATQDVQAGADRAER